MLPKGMHMSGLVHTQNMHGTLNRHGHKLKADAYVYGGPQVPLALPSKAQQTQALTHEKLLRAQR